MALVRANLDHTVVVVGVVELTTSVQAFLAPVALVLSGIVATAREVVAAEVARSCPMPQLTAVEPVVITVVVEAARLILVPLRATQAARARKVSSLSPTLHRFLAYPSHSNE